MNKIKSLLQFSMELTISEWFNKHRKDLYLLSVLCLVMLIIFGQKLFFVSFTTDDYNRFYLHDNTSYLISESGRWGQVLLNQYIFQGNLQILPYLHGLIGILSFTSMAFFTVRYWGVKNPLPVFFAVLLMVATPMIAHNLVFSTNITAWISMFFGLIGFFLFSKSKNIFIKIFAFLLFVFAVGNYQTIIQIALVIVIIKSIIELIDQIQKDNMWIATIQKISFQVLFIGMSLIASNLINNYFINLYHLHKADRYANFDHIFQFDFLYNLIEKFYTSSIRFDYFSEQLNMLYCVELFFVCTILFLSIFLKKISYKNKLITCFLILMMIIVLPIILNLPLLVENWIALRSHLAIGWFLGGLYILGNRYARVNIVRTFLYINILAIIVAHLYYIAIFYDAHVRQTTYDIQRANVMVERIRKHENYMNEPIKLKIIGINKESVIGMKQKFNQAFFTNEAKYTILENFTDLQFQHMTDDEYKKIKKYIVSQGDTIDDYPAKKSVLVYQGMAIIFLDASEMNQEIIKAKYLSKLPKEPADIQNVFDIFYQKKLLYYKKKPCVSKDIIYPFFVRIYPKDSFVDKNSVNDNYDFDFLEYGKIKNGECDAAIPLPKYPIGLIRTGQFQRGVKIFWEENYYPGGKK